MRRAIVVGVLFGLAAAPGPARAADRRLSLSVGGNGAFGGPNVALEHGLSAAGLGDTTPADCFLFCSGPTAHPVTHGAGLGPGWALGYLVGPLREGRPVLGVRLLHSTTDFGVTVGFRAPATFAFLSPSASTTAVLATATFRGGGRLGVGPSLSRVRVTDSSGGGEQSLVATTRAGLVTEAALTLPAHKRFFVELAAQLRLLRPARTRAYDVNEGLRGSPLILPATRVPLTHATLALSFGLRL